MVTVLGYLAYMASVVISYSVKWRKFNWYAIISFILLLGFRGCGIDYFYYRLWFEYLVTLPYGLFDPHFFNSTLGYAPQGFEFPYLILIKICKNFGWPNIVFFATIAAGQVILLDLFLQKLNTCKKRMAVVFFFFTTLLFVECFNVMRQMIALLAFMNIIQYIEQRNWKKYFICCSLICLIHSSALLLFPMYFFIHKDLFKDRRAQFIGYLFASGLSALVISKIVLLFRYLFRLLSFIDIRIIHYLDMSRTDIMFKPPEFKISTFVFKLVCISFIIYYSTKFKKNYGKKGVILYNLTFLGFLIQEFYFSISIQRLNYYFYYAIFALMGLMFNMVYRDIGHKKDKIFCLFVAFVYTAWFCNSVLKGAAGCAPYQLSSIIQ